MKLTFVTIITVMAHGLHKKVLYKNNNGSQFRLSGTNLLRTLPLLTSPTLPGALLISITIIFLFILTLSSRISSLLSSFPRLKCDFPARDRLQLSQTEFRGTVSLSLQKLEIFIGLYDLNDAHDGQSLRVSPSYNMENHQLWWVFNGARPNRISVYL